MPIVYINECRNFSEAMNNILFEMSVPEYYDPSVSNYYKKPRPTDKPIVNGQEMEWDEYLATHPGAKQPDSFIPAPIYKAEDMNRAFSMKSVSDIIDLTINNVVFEFIHPDDIERVIGIMDGYYKEVATYIPFNARLKSFMTGFSQARIKLYDAYRMQEIYRENTRPIDQQKPKSLAEILEGMTYARR